jgi:hypothetical protein
MFMFMAKAYLARASAIVTIVHVLIEDLVHVRMMGKMGYFSTFPLISEHISFLLL